jgi:hypothetical protein
MKNRILIGCLLLISFGIYANYKMEVVEAGFLKNITDGISHVEAKAVSEEWIWLAYDEFTPSFGDYFMVDVTNGFGYLINDSKKSYTVFPVMTGAKRTPTPYKEWVVLQKSIQSNRVVFSKSGEFFRMYENGTKRTSYGIHGYAYFKDEIGKGRKFLSLGCIMVADDVLDIIEESYIANGNSLKVSTRESIDLLSYLGGVSL